MLTSSMNWVYTMRGSATIFFGQDAKASREFSCKNCPQASGERQHFRAATTYYLRIYSDNLVAILFIWMILLLSMRFLVFCGVLNEPLKMLYCT